MDYIPGIDVSRYQGTIDWQAVRAAGKQFAFIKATESTSWVDPRFAENWAGAKAVGMLRSAYHFFRPLADARKQAEHFLATVPLEPGDLPPTLDLEVAENLTSATIIERAKTWLDEIEAHTGRKPVIYSGVAYLNTHFRTGSAPPAWTADYILWIANYLALTATKPNMPQGWNRWHFWQYTSTGKVDGISGNVDLDWFNGTLTELQALAGATGTTAVPWTYTVQSGDTLESIAARFNLALTDLVAANPGLASPGMVLKLPGGDPGVRSVPFLYIVQPRETLAVIAARFNIPIDFLAQANLIADPNALQPGQQIIIVRPT